MKPIPSLILSLLILLSSCKDDDKTHELQITRALKEKEWMPSCAAWGKTG